MRQRQLGNTGLTVSEIGMGTWELGGREWGDKARSLPQAALKFILAHPTVSCAVLGIMTPAQVDDGVATSGAAPLPAAALDQLRNN